MSGLSTQPRVCYPDSSRKRGCKSIRLYHHYGFVMKYRYAVVYEAEHIGHLGHNLKHMGKLKHNFCKIQQNSGTTEEIRAKTKKCLCTFQI